MKNKIFHTRIWHTINNLKLPFALKAVALNHIEDIEMLPDLYPQEQPSPYDLSAFIEKPFCLDTIQLDIAFPWAKVGTKDHSWNFLFWSNLHLYMLGEIEKDALISRLKVQKHYLMED